MAPRADGQRIWQSLASSTIARALAISLMLHFLVIGGLEFGRQMDWWTQTMLPASTAKIVDEMLRKQEPPETQLVFVEVDPSQAAPEAPKEAKYYSSENSVASNPDTQVDLQTPKVEGGQELIPRTMDTMRPQAPPEQPQPLQPDRAQPEPEVQPEPPKEQDQPKTEDGDLVVAKAAPRPPPARQQPPRNRPRTLAEARAQKGIIEAPKMKQDGGTRRHSLLSSLDAKATPFGAYDAAFIAAVQARWYSLLDERDFAGNQSGKVVVEFRLTRTGRIVDLRVAGSEVSEMLSWLCQRAILDPAPYAEFPPDMRRLLRSDYRDVRFTFYYNH